MPSCVNVLSESRCRLRVRGRALQARVQWVREQTTWRRDETYDRIYAAEVNGRGATGFQRDDRRTATKLWKWSQEGDGIVEILMRPGIASPHTDACGARSLTSM